MEGTALSKLLRSAKRASNLPQIFSILLMQRGMRAEPGEPQGASERTPSILPSKPLAANADSKVSGKDDSGTGWGMEGGAQREGAAM